MVLSDDEYIDKLTVSHKYGTSIKATPAETLLAPTPMFLIVVGYNSAVNTGIIALEALIEHLANITSVVINHWAYPNMYGIGNVRRQPTPAIIMVRDKGHLLPIRKSINMLSATPGTSTAPDITLN